MKRNTCKLIGTSMMVLLLATGCGKVPVLENGQEAVAFFGRLSPDTEVLCTVLKKSTKQWRVLVSIDAVLEREIAA